jgi:molybdate transport system substrate-binding protein
MFLTRSAAGLAAVLLSACGAADGAPPHVTVFAAASLTDAFKAEAAALGVAKVDFNFAGSSTLVTQLRQGATADLLASADEANMQQAVGAGLTAEMPRTFATNRLEIAVAPGNPKRITGLADLARPGVVVVLCSASVPCGAYAGAALKAAGLAIQPASVEADVKGVVGKVALGEADAGIVYVTDVQAAGARVSGVPIPDAQNQLARYPVARLKGGRAQAAAVAFEDLLLSDRGRAILARYGFGPPG